MKLLEQKIAQEGTVIGTDILKVDMFLNHQIDVGLLNEMGKEFYRLFGHEQIDKIVTIEASGIAIACVASQYFNHVPVVFAKKTESRNLDAEVYESKVYSFTKQKEYSVRVSKKYLQPGEHVLIIDDFLANGQAVLGLIDIIRQAGAVPCGAGIAIEKGHQKGRSLIEAEGVRVESLAIVASMSEEDGVKFA